jgi:hypothetical protein
MTLRRVPEWHVRGEGFTVSTHRRIFGIMPPFPMTADRATTFQEMTARLGELTKRLDSSSSPSERRTLLRQFRFLLDEAEKLTSGQSTTILEQDHARSDQ